MTMLAPSDASAGFSGVTIEELEALQPRDFDALPYSVVGLSADGITEVYNLVESRLAGLTQSSVIGKPYFSTTAQCMNNFMVAQRFDDEPWIDSTIDFVLTLRMRPTPVRLRLLKDAAATRRYILIERKTAP